MGRYLEPVPAGSVVEDESRENRRLPTALIILAGVLTILGFWSLLEFEHWLREIGSWPVYVALAALYGLTQIVVEGILSTFWQSKRIFSRVFAIAVIIAFYAVSFG